MNGSQLWLLVASVALLVAVLLAIVAGARGAAAAAQDYQRRFTGTVGRRLNHLLLFIDARRLFEVNLLIALATVAIVAVVTHSWLLVAVSVVAIGIAPNLLLVHLARRRRARFAAQLPDALLLVAGAMRAGASLPLALRQMASELPAPCGQEFDLMLREQQLGVTLDEALGGLERRMGGDDLRLVVAAVRIASDSGGNLAETLERLAETVRRRIGVEAKIRALTAQGRLQGWVMTALPIAVCLALFMIDPASMRPLIDSWQGWAVCALILVLELAGLLFIRRIMAIDI